MEDAGLSDRTFLKAAMFRMLQRFFQQNNDRVIQFLKDVLELIICEVDFDMVDQSHSLHSSLREKILEHLFIGDVLKCLWQKGIRDIEVLKAEVDSGGYDVVISCQETIRHIQLKASYKGSATSEQKVQRSLGTKPSGCVVWMQFNPKSLNLGPFYWFGGSPGQPLPNIANKKVAKHTKGNAQGVKLERPNIRVLVKRDFIKLETINDVVFQLFGI